MSRALITLATYYFLLNVALTLEVWSRQGPAYVDLLFSFECCLDEYVVFHPSNPPFRDSLLFSFEFCRSGEASGERCNAQRNACYFLLNVA